jgi:phage tail sheath protein FI
VVDEDGEITGKPDTLLERYEGLSKASDGRDESGALNYYSSVINNRSAWVWFVDHPSTGTNWGNTAAGITFSTPVATIASSLSGGAAGETVTDAELEEGLDLFKSDSVEFSFVLGANANATVANYIINEIVEPHKYAMAFLSPLYANVVDNAGSEAEDIVAFRDTLPSTSYAVLDSGWKYMYDKYNQVYRYVPLNGDVAGLAARTDQVSETWFSPAGFNRGQLKIGNTVKLAYNPNQTDRDTLYLKGINPVVSFPGEGTVLYGDKTLQTKPSAFDRINVRRLFIALEKTIDRSAKFQLFEQNDEFTRNQFVNTIEPFLRSVKGRRGISDFYVVCDETNNPQDAVDRNEFRADIYVKPVRSINFIQLNFVAVRSDVSFNEVITNLG